MRGEGFENMDFLFKIRNKKRFRTREKPPRQPNPKKSISIILMKFQLLIFHLKNFFLVGETKWVNMRISGSGRQK